MMKSPSSIPQNTDQKQFLTILSREEALARFEAALFPWSVPTEKRSLAEALGLALAEDVAAQVDIPPFDRSNVDGFAVRAADLVAASDLQPVRLMLNRETIACGSVPQFAVLPGTATAIATGGLCHAVRTRSSWWNILSQPRVGPSKCGVLSRRGSSSPPPDRTWREERSCCGLGR